MMQGYQGTLCPVASTPQLSFEQVATPPATLTSWEWIADHSSHIFLHDIDTCTWHSRKEEALSVRDADRVYKHELSRGVSNTIPFAARL